MGNTGSSQASFSLKEKCAELTIGEYIRLVCHNENRVLIKSGDPDKFALNDAKMGVIVEYATLSGGTNLRGSFGYYETILALKCDLLQIRIAAQLMASQWNEAVAMLKRCGAQVSRLVRDDIAKTSDYIESLIKMKTTHLEKAVTDYNKRATKEGGKKLTEADVRREMVIVGGDGIIPDECNLATYAAKVMVYREQIKAFEDAKRRSVSKK